jgi:hypothetical protein
MALALLSTVTLPRSVLSILINFVCSKIKKLFVWILPGNKARKTEMTAQRFFFALKILQTKHPLPAN